MIFKSLLKFKVYLSLSFRLMFISPDWIIRNVKRMVFGRRVWVVSTLNDKRVGFVSNNVDFRNQQTVDEPWNSPTDMTFWDLLTEISIQQINTFYLTSNCRVSMLSSCWSHLSVKHSVFRFYKLKYVSEWNQQPINSPLHWIGGISHASLLATGLGVGTARVVVGCCFLGGSARLMLGWFNFWVCGRLLASPPSSESAGLPSFSGIGQFQKGWRPKSMSLFFLRNSVW